MRILIFFYALLVFLQVEAQTKVASAEWFVDNDPGYGEANAIAFPSGDIELDWLISLNDLNPGVHYLGIRVKNSIDVWSPTHNSAFLVVPNPKPDVVYAEWFIDEDPGFGKGTPFFLNPSEDELAWNIDLSSLEPGVHCLGIRTQAESGVWSPTWNRCFLITPSRDINDPIVQIDYTFTTDGADPLNFNYLLGVPRHLIDIDFLTETDGLMPNTAYRLCFKAVTATGLESFERCFEFKTENTVRTKDILNNGRIRLFPNPATDRIQIRSAEPLDIQKLSITNTLGQIVIQEFKKTMTENFSIDIAGFQKGTYALIIETGQGLIIRPFVKVSNP